MPLATAVGDEFDAAAKKFPWRLVGYDSVPYLGPAVMAPDAFALERAVDAILEVIDDRLGSTFVPSKSEEN